MAPQPEYEAVACQGGGDALAEKPPLEAEAMMHGGCDGRGPKSREDADWSTEKAMDSDLCATEHVRPQESEHCQLSGKPAAARPGPLGARVPEGG